MKPKLKLNDLKVTSFVTALGKNTKLTLNGGILPPTDQSRCCPTQLCYKSITCIPQYAGACGNPDRYYEAMQGFTKWLTCNC